MRGQPLQDLYKELQQSKCCPLHLLPLYQSSDQEVFTLKYIQTLIQILPSILKMPALQVDTTVACCDMINLVHNHCCSCCDNDSYCLLSTSPASVHSFAQDCRVQDSKRSDVNPKTQTRISNYINKGNLCNRDKQIGSFIQFRHR